MTTLTTDRFIAERQLNGDVLIKCMGDDAANNISHIPVTISIPKETCMQLAMLMVPDHFQTMECSQIKPGMIFELEQNGELETYRVIRADETAQRQNRYYCVCWPYPGSKRPETLMCFDQVFLKSKYNFRFIKECGQAMPSQSEIDQFKIGQIVLPQQ